MPLPPRWPNAVFRLPAHCAGSLKSLHRWLDAESLTGALQLGVQRSERLCRLGADACYVLPIQQTVNERNKSRPLLNKAPDRSGDIIFEAVLNVDWQLEH